MDDIRLNSSMARLWEDLSAAYCERAIDITDYSCRERNVGFGLLILGPFVKPARTTRRVPHHAR